MDTSSHAALQGCVSSLRTSMQQLESSINILDSGVSDYPRLAKVLQTTRVSSASHVFFFSLTCFRIISTSS